MADEIKIPVKVDTAPVVTGFKAVENAAKASGQSMGQSFRAGGQVLSNINPMLGETARLFKDIGEVAGVSGRAMGAAGMTLSASVAAVSLAGLAMYKMWTDASESAKKHKEILTGLNKLYDDISEIPFGGKIKTQWDEAEKGLEGYVKKLKDEEPGMIKWLYTTIPQADGSTSSKDKFLRQETERSINLIAAESELETVRKKQLREPAMQNFGPASPTAEVDKKFIQYMQAVKENLGLDVDTGASAGRISATARPQISGLLDKFSNDPEKLAIVKNLAYQIYNYEAAINKIKQDQLDKYNKIKEAEQDQLDKYNKIKEAEQDQRKSAAALAESFALKNQGKLADAENIIINAKYDKEVAAATKANDLILADSLEKQRKEELLRVKNEEDRRNAELDALDDWSEQNDKAQKEAKDKALQQLLDQEERDRPIREKWMPKETPQKQNIPMGFTDIMGASRLIQERAGAGNPLVEATNAQMNAMWKNSEKSDKLTNSVDALNITMKSYGGKGATFGK